MSLSEIKQAIRELTPEEWMEVQACLWEAAGVPVQHSPTLDEKMAKMNAGRFVRWEDVRDDVLKRESLPDE